MDANGWRPISEAPKNTLLLVGRFVNDGWHICESGLYYDAGCIMEGEIGYWYWSCDYDPGCVTVDEGPSHWMPLPPPPAQEGGIMHKSIAESMPKPVRLECEVCGRRRPLNNKQTSSYLESGWPECCSYTMTLITENDIKREQKGK